MPHSRSRILALAPVILALAGCNGGERRLLSSSAVGGERALLSADESTQDEQEEALEEEVPEPAGEAVARALLAKRFREAGFRIRYDVQVGRPGDFELTVDGFDPASGVGFEYVDPAERDTDLDPRERLSLERDETYRILIVDPAPADQIETRAARFLATIESRE